MDEIPDTAKYSDNPIGAFLRAAEFYRELAKPDGEAKVTREREAIVERLCTEMKRNHPELAQSIADASRSGFFLFLMFYQALESIDNRNDLSQADRNEAASDAQEFLSIFKAVRDAPSGICPRELVFRFGQAALSIGLSAV
jgi:hypothetical protein